MKIRSRLEFFLAKIAGRNIDIGTLVPPVASTTTEELMLEVSDRLDNIENQGGSEASIGDVTATLRDDLSEDWLPCDGRLINENEYPELASILPYKIFPSGWDYVTLGEEFEDSDVCGMIYENNTYVIYGQECSTGHWHPSIWYTTNPADGWTKKILSDKNYILAGDTTHYGFVYADNLWVYYVSLRNDYFSELVYFYSNSLDGDWTFATTGMESFMSGSVQVSQLNYYDNAWIGIGYSVGQDGAPADYFIMKTSSILVTEDEESATWEVQTLDFQANRLIFDGIHYIAAMVGDSELSSSYIYYNQYLFEESEGWKEVPLEDDIYISDLKYINDTIVCLGSIEGEEFTLLYTQDIEDAYDSGLSYARTPSGSPFEEADFDYLPTTNVFYLDNKWIVAYVNRGTHFIAYKNNLNNGQEDWKTLRPPISPWGYYVNNKMISLADDYPFVDKSLLFSVPGYYLPDNTNNEIPCYIKATNNNA